MGKNLVKPPRLAPGDVIAVVAPSAGHAGRYPRRTARGVKALESLGFTVEVMPHAAQDSSWVSGTIGERVSDLHAAFADEQVRGIVTTIGGDHSAQLLESLDFGLIAANPKVFCGYSDITSLLHAVYAKTGLVTFYGPALLPQFGEWPEPLPETVGRFRAATSTAAPVGALPEYDSMVAEFIDWSEDETEPRQRGTAIRRRLLRDGIGQGPLIAGCVPTIRHLIGTPWLPDYEGSVLVLDIPDMDYEARRLDADLWHLRNAGILSGLAGLVIGRPRSLSPAVIDEVCDVVTEAVRPYRYPVLAQFECGHCDPAATLPIGVTAVLSGTTLTVPESAVD